jgi:hypothetical protein
MGDSVARNSRSVGWHAKISKRDEEFCLFPARREMIEPGGRVHPPAARRKGWNVMGKRSFPYARVGFVLTALGCIAFFAGCGSEDLTGHGCGVAGAPTTCGKTCSVDGNCGLGSYCGADLLCTADCLRGGNECGDGKQCDDNGKCFDLTNGGVPCVGLECKVNHMCAGGNRTTITGKVFAPNGTLPLYNAAVYVPNGSVDAIAPGVTCDRCDGKLPGNPVSFGATGPDGSFSIADVPTGTDIPLVIQLGRWRRQIKIPAVADCAATAIPDTLTRLPKNAAEGDIPKMAIATGKADAFECLLLKIGIDPGEITTPAGTGRVHFFTATNAPGLNLMPPAPKATELYSSLDKMLAYDVILLPCEGAEFDKSRANGMTLNPNPRDLLVQYVNMGGRVFSTHYSYDWLTYNSSPFNKLATPTGNNGLWPVGQKDDYNSTIVSQLVTSFPKGMDFAKWLIAAGAASAMNTLNIAEGRSDVIGVDTTLAQPWATYDFTPIGGKPAVMHFTFNTPLDAPKDAMGVPAYCGRVVFSDFHVTAGAVTMGETIFPAACKMDPMTDQEKALAFMLFDLSSCVQQDTTAPIL